MTQRKPLHALAVQVTTALLAVCMLVAACSDSQPRFHGVDLSVAPAGGDFELTAHDGRRWRLAEQRGKVVLLFFGYTHCPDICSPALTRLALLMQDLGEQAARVEVVFVTVDPARDNVEQLAGFVPKFHPRFIGLTGSAREIEQVAAMYRSAYEQVPGKPGLFAHSGNVYAVDPAGRLRLAFRDATPVADMVHDLKLLLDL